MLGVPVETFRGNKIVMTAVALVMLGVAWGAYEACKDEGVVCWAWSLVVLGPLGFLLYWLSSVEIIIYDGGFSSKTCLGSTEMRWDDVTRFTYSATRQSVNFIPVGTYYHLKIEGEHGRKLTLGNRAGQMEKLATELLRRTLPPILKRAVDQYNSGAELDFGAIKLSKGAGFKGKSFFKTVTIPLNEVVGYRIESGLFLLYQQGKRLAALSPPLIQVPNAFALVALLDSIYHQPAPSVAKS